MVLLEQVILRLLVSVCENVSGEENVQKYIIVSVSPLSFFSLIFFSCRGRRGFCCNAETSGVNIFKNLN